MYEMYTVHPCTILEHDEHWMATGQLPYFLPFLLIA